MFTDNPVKNSEYQENIVAKFQISFGNSKFLFANLNGVTPVDLRAEFAGVFGLFSKAVATEKVLRVFGVFGGFVLAMADEGEKGLKILGDFNLSIFRLAVLAVSFVTFWSDGWKNGFAAGDPNTNAFDLSRVVAESLKLASTEALPPLFLLTPMDCKKLNECLPY